MRSTARSISSTRPWCCTPRMGVGRTMSRPCCRPCWTATALRLQVDDDGSGDWALSVPNQDRCGRAIVCNRRRRLDRGRGDYGALGWTRPPRRAPCGVGGRHRLAGADHPPPAVDGVSANPVGGHQHRLGAASQRPADRAADRRNLVCPLVEGAGEVRPHRHRGRPSPGGRSPRRLRRCRPLSPRHLCHRRATVGVAGHRHDASPAR